MCPRLEPRHGYWAVAGVAWWAATTCLASDGSSQSNASILWAAAVQAADSVCDTAAHAAAGRATGSHAPAAHAASVPTVTVSALRRVFQNGEHDAFPDLCRFGGQLYLAFRSCPGGHVVHSAASIIGLRILDAKEWEQAHRFRVPLRDTHNPHFLVFNRQLFVRTGTWYSGPRTIPPEKYDLNQHLGYAVWSEDGTSWHGPVMLEGHSATTSGVPRRMGECVPLRAAQARLRDQGQGSAGRRRNL